MMRNIFLKRFIPFFIAFFLFLFIIVPEARRFSAIIPEKSPYPTKFKEEAIDIPKDATVPRELFLPTGEFFLFFPGTKFNFSPREFVTGDFFWSTSLLKEFPPREVPIAFEGTLPQTGEFLFQGFIFRSRGGSAFFHRDAEKNILEIYAFGMPLDIYGRNGASFSLPSGKKVIIPDALLSPKTFQIFYSKIKKEFQLQSFSLQDAVINEDKNIERLFMGLERLRFWEDKIFQYVSLFYKNYAHVKETFLTSLLKDFQYRFSFGLSSEKKNEFFIQKTLAPFLSAYLSLEDQKVVSGAKISSFFKTFSSPEWELALKRNPKFMQKWKDFIASHRVWIKKLPEGDLRKELIAVLPPLSPQDAIDEAFFNLSESLRKDDFFALQGSLEKFVTVLEKNLANLSRADVTRYRRFFVEILKENDFLHTESMFGLYKSFIDREIELYADSPSIFNELTLENVQDILSFLRYLVDQKNKFRILQNLIQIYKSFDILKIQSIFGIQVFSPEDQKFVSLLFAVEQSGATPALIEKLRQENAKTKEFSSQIEAYKEVPKKPSIAVKRDLLGNYIAGAEELKSFLEKFKIDTSRLKVVTSISPEFGNFTTFTNAFFGENSFSGKFFYETQVFNPLLVNDQKFVLIPPRFFEQTVRDFLVKKPTESTEEEVVFTVPQNTPLAILNKTLAQEKLLQKGITVARADIIVLDESMESFYINGAFWEKARLTFYFYPQFNAVSHLTAQVAKDFKDFGEVFIPFDDFESLLIKTFPRVRLQR